MSVEITHLGHNYTYHHPIGWSGGDERICEKLNAHRPAGDYPEDEAEKVAISHALAGILAGGEVIAPASTKHGYGDLAAAEQQDAAVSKAGTRPDRILEEGAEDGLSSAPAHDPDRILDESGDEDRSGDPDRILEG